MAVDVYADFIAKYPVFSNQVFGGRIAYDAAYNLALNYVVYYENLGLNWGNFRQIAIEFKTACELQNKFNQKSGSLAAINEPSTTPKQIKSISIDGEYNVEYETSGISSSKQLEMNNQQAGYYCQEFDNLKNLLFSDQLGDGFLYSHECILYPAKTTNINNPQTPTSGVEISNSAYTRTFVQSNLDVANILVVFHQLNSTLVQVSIKNNNNIAIIPDKITYGGADTIYIELASFAPLQGMYTVLITK